MSLTRTALALYHRTEAQFHHLTRPASGKPTTATSHTP